MSIKARSSLLSSVIIAVLFFSAIGPTIVYADGGTTTDTPPTDATATPPTPADDFSGTGAPHLNKGAPVAQPSSPAQSSGDSSHSGSSVLNNVPANTTVQVLNAAGQTEPLATQAAAEAIVTSDPIWCPAAQATPTPGANGCTSSFSSFSALLTFLAGNATYTGAGTIYVQQGAYQGGETVINFNNYNLSNISSANLTITGGWNTSTNVVDNTTTSNFNNVAFVIGSAANPWGGSLSINNLALNFTPTGNSGTGITAVSAMDINVANVTVMNSATGAGADLTATNDVNIRDSKFDRNKTAGAIIHAGRDVAILNTSFSNPTNGRRQVTGVDITAGRGVSLLNVLANTNRQAGATINAGGRVSIGSSFFSDTKAMQGSNFIGYGLQVTTPDAIDLNAVTANDNFLWGASLNAGGAVSIANSFFNANTTASPGFIDDTGLLVTSGGNVSLLNVEANDNRLIGATIDAQGDVSVTDSRFNGNTGVTLDSAGNQTFHGYGLNVLTPGNIFLSGVTASNNTLFGAHLEAGLDVNISGSDFSGQTTGSATDLLGRGLEVVGGNVLIDNTTLNNNQTFGANIQATGAVFLDTVTASGNATNGVEVQGTCSTVFLINGTYTNNGQYGLSVTNGRVSPSGTPVFSGNGTGDIFQDPGTCVFSAPTTGGGSTDTPNTPPVTSRPGGSVVGTSTGSLVSVGSSASTDAVIRSFDNAAGNMGGETLNSFLANTKLANGAHVSLFMGRYAYIYSLQGMQIVAYVPTMSDVAMVAP